MGLGSNLSSPKKNILKAYAYLKNSYHFRILKMSHLYLTSPIGPRQNNFINAVVKIKTDLSPAPLLRALKDIEKRMGRKKTGKRWGPRVIDIDILLYEKRIINLKKLNIPHREMLNRRFVLEPLLEIAPGLAHPVIKRKIKEILKSDLTLKKQKVKILQRAVKL
ncbi:MAG: 2-amino-4-hydroxy-6-hydroxymethyldihydropteridine diphosphokinase [Endomicrobiales bacterium]|nr:2-amino-4-hydroxy-6-hydroxymethyldihydropteridine diphosphokinase [Endomicrobiales bacterium]